MPLDGPIHATTDYAEEPDRRETWRMATGNTCRVCGTAISRTAHYCKWCRKGPEVLRAKEQAQWIVQMAKEKKGANNGRD